MRNISFPKSLRPLRHLIWLPLLVLAQFLFKFFCRPLSGLFVPLGVSLIAAICLEEFLRMPLSRVEQSQHGGRGRKALVLFSVVAALLLALYFGFAKGARYRGGGDVTHYRMMVTNLATRGNLDITDYMETMMAGDGVIDEEAKNSYLKRSHARRNLRGRIYSVHSFGFPLLVWPFREVFGAFGDVFALALIGAAALVGVWASCLSHGAAPLAANVTTALTGLSFVWIYATLSFLPEMLGFGLCAWAFWAIPAQHSPGRRLAATVISAIACAYLPYAHVRFTPLALCLGGFFGVEGLLVANEPFWRCKIPRLAGYATVCLAAWVGVWLCHRHMFAGTMTYDFQDIAGRTPLVAWAVFSDRRGLVAVFPPLGAYLAATVCAAARGGSTARHAAMALVSLSSVLYFCCCTTAALSGACMNGRYLYNAIPLLIPFFAIALHKADREGKIWLLFLSMMPILYFFFVSFQLSGAKLLRAPEPMRRLRAFKDFWEPFPSFYKPPMLKTRIVGSIFSASLIIVSFLACIRRSPRKRRIVAVILLSVALLAGLFVNSRQPPKRYHMPVPPPTLAK